MIGKSVPYVEMHLICYVIILIFKIHGNILIWIICPSCRNVFNLLCNYMIFDNNMYGIMLEVYANGVRCVDLEH